MGTHAESYRRFEGRLRPRLLRFAPITGSGIRLAGRRRIALLLLFLFPAGWTIVFCFQVYTKFALEQGTATGGVGGIPATAAMELAARLIEVRELVFQYFSISKVFALLVSAWFGAGLLADDRRLGAHLLYFSRPITRLDYLLGKLLVVSFYSALAVLVPGLVICFTAAASSPDWVFLEEEPEVVVGTLLYGLLAVAYYGLLALAASSVASRRAFALAGIFGVVLLGHAAGGVLSRLFEQPGWRLLSPFSNFRRVATWLLEVRSWSRDWPVEWSLAVLGGTMLGCVLLLVWRVRRLELVA